MKILLVTPMPPEREAAGAIPLVLHAQLTALRPSHELTWVTVAGPDPREWKALDCLRATGVRVAAVRRTEPYGIRRWQRRWRWATTWLGTRYPWRTIWFWEPAVQQILDRLFATESFDIIQVEDNAMGIYRYQTETPILFTEYEVRPDEYIRLEAAPTTLRGKLYDALRENDWQRWMQYQQSVWQRFTRLQVFTSRDAQALRRIAPELADRVIVNPFGIELPARHYSDVNTREILFVGNFTHPPNVDAALWLGREIMPLLCARVPDARLNLVGSYAPTSVRALASDAIRLLGYVPELEPIIARAAVIVAPLRLGGGQRMKVLQSMALGKAVVTTLLGAEGLEVETAQPPLIIRDNAAEIANAIAELLEQPERRRELGCQAREFIAMYHSVPAYARRLEATYRELLNIE